MASIGVGHLRCPGVTIEEDFSVPFANCPVISADRYVLQNMEYRVERLLPETSNSRSRRLPADTDGYPVSFSSGSQAHSSSLDTSVSSDSGAVRVTSTSMRPMGLD